MPFDSKIQDAGKSHLQELQRIAVLKSCQLMISPFIEI